MDNKTFAKLVGDLREDEALFHAFVFEPDTALEKLGYLEDSIKRRLRAVDPQSFVADATGWLERERVAGGCGPETTCSCTSVTCSGVTCGGSTCNVTCTESSCGNTCGDSCGMTTNVANWFRNIPSSRGGSVQVEGQVWDDANIAWDWESR
jgi:hypothetical protein